MSNSELSFKGKRALVTGAGRGIGRQVAKQLAKCGAEVIALSKTQSNLDSLKDEYSNIQTFCVDLGNWDETREIVKKIGIVDYLVNNAGILLNTTFEDITKENFDKTFDVNVKAMINISQCVVKKLKENGRSGSIVNVSSDSTWVNNSGEAVYCLSKATVDRLTRLMAKELGPFNIRVNSVNPTWVETDMTINFLTDPKTEAEIKGNIPLRRFCTVENIADSILFLLSDKASMITGISMPIDGGELVN